MLLSLGQGSLGASELGPEILCPASVGWECYRDELAVREAIWRMIEEMYEDLYYSTK